MSKYRELVTAEIQKMSEGMLQEYDPLTVGAFYLANHGEAPVWGKRLADKPVPPDSDDVFQTRIDIPELLREPFGGAAALVVERELVNDRSGREAVVERQVRVMPDGAEDLFAIVVVTQPDLFGADCGKSTRYTQLASQPWFSEVGEGQLEGPKTLLRRATPLVWLTQV